MTRKIEASEFRLLRDYIEKHCGIRVDEQKTYLIETRLTALMVENGCKTYKEFYHKALADSTNVLREKIIDAMTTNETLWFRDNSPFSVLKEIVLPQYIKELSERKRQRVRIWSAACSTGQEPYSIAITILELLKEHPYIRPEQFEIVATDISPTVLFLAKAGRYDSIVIARGLPDTIKDRYFTLDGKVWVLNDMVKKMVSFKKLNLQDSYTHMGKFDTIFCRNVMIYFSDQFKKDIFSRLAMLLRPSGYLFVGASESVINYSTEFQMMNHKRALYYKAK
ncbi:MAG: CheR family methyltransferase [Chitinispirillaceae bacterium]